MWLWSERFSPSSPRHAGPRFSSMPANRGQMTAAAQEYLLSLLLSFPPRLSCTAHPHSSCLPPRAPCIDMDSARVHYSVSILFAFILSGFLLSAGCTTWCLADCGPSAGGGAAVRWRGQARTQRARRCRVRGLHSRPGCTRSRLCVCEFYAAPGVAGVAGVAGVSDSRRVWPVRALLCPCVEWMSTYRYL